jgi:hypothetical protein
LKTRRPVLEEELLLLLNANRPSGPRCLRQLAETDWPGS